MIAADTSVVVAAFASWHESHEPARAALSGKVRLVGQCALESYSVLTRLPAPHRAAPALVRDFLAGEFPDPYLVMDEAGQRDFVFSLADLGITGGAVYDALVGTIAARARATLLSLDTRAASTYARVGVQVELLEAR